MKIVFNFLLLVVMVLIGVLSSKKERFDIDNGICDCCDCGWMSCEQCSFNRQECCGDSIGFDRYTFS